MARSDFVEERGEIDVDLWRGQVPKYTEVELERKWLWLLVGVPGALVMMTLVAFLYGALELPWSAYDSLGGFVLIILVPFFCGAAFGIGTNRMRDAIIVAWAVSLAATALGAYLSNLPYSYGTVSGGSAYVGQGWTVVFLFIVAFISTTSAGAAVARAASEVE